MPHRVRVQSHQGSSQQDIKDEPDWQTSHEHRIGYRNRQDRVPGLTHAADEGDVIPHLADRSSPSEAESDECKDAFENEANEELHELRSKEGHGELVNFRDLIKDQRDFHLRYPENRSIGWRYVLDATEHWVKNEQRWPANIKREQEAARRKEEEHAGKDNKDGKDDKDDKDGDQNGDQSKDDESSEKGDDQQSQQSDEEEDWKRKTGKNDTHHDAYATGDEQDSEEQKMEYKKLRERYSPQEIALLRALQHEMEYRQTLQQNDGKGASPQTQNRSQISIDEQDQFSPDNWLPRSNQLTRLTGKHPLNAEADLTALYEAGLITPNELHYVRNHGTVPRILWEAHRIDVENGKLILTMHDLKDKFEAINIPVSLACDGNRRKELNMIKRSKGFNWGAGATGCVYWKGPLLRDILLAVGVDEPKRTGTVKHRWVNFQGADDLSEGKYETCIPLDYAMDTTNDVLLAYEMNNVPLPPDHGYPVRLLIPGYIGGRCVKWLSKIWVTDTENSSHYHIWDNRVLPSIVTEKDGDFARTMFMHPDTACNEQNLNSVIVRPAQGETISLTEARSGKTYRIQGYAYDGGGHEVERVEVSLDGGASWLYCIRRFPEYPIRHGKKFWTWLHWYVDVEIPHLVGAKSITVRAWNVFKNTQPENPIWNTMGMMNNCWYTVKAEMAPREDDDIVQILFRHPVQPGTGDAGWMQPSEENKIASAKQDAGAPGKQFTRQEIEKHFSDDDCWIVVDGKVYDVTSVLSWHPGGKAAIVGHAGKVHQQTSDEFASIHDDFAYQKLNECVMGVVTEKAANFIRQNAKAAAKEQANRQGSDEDIVLQKHRWVPVTLRNKENVSEDTRRYTFDLPAGGKDLGLGTCQHIQLGFHLRDKMLVRSYTPTKPLLPDPNKSSKESKRPRGQSSSEIKSMQDGHGTFELVVKTYFPNCDQPGGAMSNILDSVLVGEEIEVRGPTGEIVYTGQGKFDISGEEMTFKRINLILGGSGLTPGYALIVRAILGTGENVQLQVVNANKSEKDILLHEELDHFERASQGRLKITHVLSHPSDEWKGLSGHVNEEIIKDSLFPPEEGTASFLCGPPTMIQKVALPALKAWGFEEDKNLFGF